MTRRIALLAALLLLPGSSVAQSLGPVISLDEVNDADFRPVDLTDMVRDRDYLEGLRDRGETLHDRDLPPPVALFPGSPELGDVLLLEADRCERGCTISDPQFQQGLAFYDFDHYAATNLAYNRVGDDYDVVIFWTTFHTTFFGGAYYSPISNDARGINGDQGRGQGETYNLGDQVYGGTELKGAILMHDWFQCDFWDQVGQGTKCTLEAPFDETFFSPYSTLAQEIGHQWGSYVEMTGANGAVLLGRDDAHWSYFFNSGGSPMEGNHWIDNGDGSFTIEETLSTGYSELDQYLMGVRAPDEMEALWFINNPSPSADPATPPWPTEGGRSGAGPQTVTGTRIDLSVDDIISKEGERIPGVADSRKLHRELWVLVHLPIDEATGGFSQERDTTAGIAKDLEDLNKMRRHWNEMMYRISDNRMRAITTVSGRDDYPNWRFNISPEGWESNDRVANTLANKDGRLVVTAGAHGAGIEHHQVKIAAEDYPGLMVSYAVPEGATGPGFFQWTTTAGGNFDDTNLVELPTNADGTMHSYVLDLSDHPGWTGFVSSVRIVPAAEIPAEGAELHISQVTFNTTPYVDVDLDGHPDTDDNCAELFNPGNADADFDGVGDLCEADTDGDGRIDDIDPCVNDAEDTCKAARQGGCCDTSGQGTPVMSFFALMGLVALRTRRVFGA